MKECVKDRRCILSTKSVSIEFSFPGNKAEELERAARKIRRELAVCATKRDALICDQWSGFAIDVVRDRDGMRGEQKI